MQIAKYSASGNDFVIFHTDEKIDRSVLAKELCHRQDGIGADGLIVIVPHDTYDFEWQFYNSDGSTAEMCGNGSRACAHYAFTHSLAPKNMSFLTEAGVIKAEVDGSIVLSELTPPIIIEKNIEFNGKNWWKIDTGVPHMVSFSENIEVFDTPSYFDDIPKYHKIIHETDMANNFQAYYEKSKKHLSKEMISAIERGLKYSAKDYAEAIDFMKRSYESYKEVFEDYHGVLTPSSAGVAPKGLKSTGSPEFCTIWTYMGLPTISLPLLIGANNLPLGVQLIGDKLDDLRFLGVANWLEKNCKKYAK